jgi:hypothetical protein
MLLFPHRCIWIGLVAAAAVSAQQLEIVEATYGAGNFQMNVTQKLQSLVRDNVLDLSAEPGVLGGDPAPGTEKTLIVKYRYNGKPYQASVGDFGRIHIPSLIASLGGGPETAPAPAAPPPPASTPPPAATSAGGGRFSVGDLFGDRANAPAQQGAFRVVSARYGADTRFVDVAQRLQAMVKDDRLAVRADNATMGSDPAVSKKKALEVVYEYRGATYQARADEGRSLNLPDVNARPVQPAAATPATPQPQQQTSQAASPAVPVASSASVAPLGQPGGLRIFYARYGAGDQVVDVRERLRPALQAEALSFSVSAGSLGGDPAPGVAKTLTVIFEWKGRTFEKSAPDGQTLALP